jgi:hypothetical protein
MTTIPDSRITAVRSKDGKHLNCQICGTALAYISFYHEEDGSFLVTALRDWKPQTSGIFEPKSQAKKRHARDAGSAANNPRRDRAEDARRRVVAVNERVVTVNGTPVTITGGPGRSYDEDIALLQAGIKWRNVQGESPDRRVRCIGCPAVNWVTAASVALSKES